MADHEAPVALVLDVSDLEAPVVPLVQPAPPRCADPVVASPDLLVRATRVLLPHGVLGERLRDGLREDVQEGLLVPARGALEEATDEGDVFFGHGIDRNRGPRTLGRAGSGS